MKKYILIFCTLWITLLANAQVGINTTDPKGALDVTSINNTGLVLPRVASVEDVSDGFTNTPVEGTTVFDISRNSVCFFQNNKWVCIGRGTNGNPILEEVSVFDSSATIDYIKASNTNSNDGFGTSISLSGDGNTLAVGAISEDSCAIGINGLEFDNFCTGSGAVYVFTRTAGIWSQQAYIKSSNTNNNDQFGVSVNLSEDGNTLAVGANSEDSCATGINGVQTNNGCSNAGAVYVFTRTATVWSQEAYIKASNTESNDGFGYAISLSNDGNTLAVGAIGERSCATGINGVQTNNGCLNAGAVYLFIRTATVWSQQAYIKASNTENDTFGSSINLSGDGNTLAVSAINEGSCATGINGDQTNNGCAAAGAVYLFTRTVGVWSQQAYIKASNTQSADGFSISTNLSNDGNTLAVGAFGEDSCATGINGDQANNGCADAGAVYLFTRTAGVWSQQTYIKASNTQSWDGFYEVSLSNNGNKLVVGAYSEDSCATGVNGNQANNGCANAGSVYIFAKTAGVWGQQAYIKASNTGAGDFFGTYISLSGDGNIFAGGASNEDSCATGVNGSQTSNGCADAGAVYVITAN